MNQFSKIINHPLKFKLFLLSKLPNGFFTGLKIKKVNQQECAVEIKYKWFNKNPFRSTYFASLAMAAELSTGVLVMQSVQNTKKNISMLVVNVNGNFFKKAIGKTIFTCNQGDEIISEVEKCIQDGVAHSFTVTSIGKNEMNEEVAEFSITWSIKYKPI